MGFLRLEVFDTETAPNGTEQPLVQISALEEARIAAFESGYTAGWEDAVAAQSDDQTRVSADLARNLQTLSFTYHEARGHVLQAIRPLIVEMTSRLLPAMARDTLAPMVLETLMPLADEIAETPVTLVLNPAARGPVEALLEQATGLPLQIEEEASLGEGQVYIRLGAVETKVDLDQVTADITQAVRAFFSLTQKEKPHG